MCLSHIPVASPSKSKCCCFLVRIVSKIPNNLRKCTVNTKMSQHRHKDTVLNKQKNGRGKKSHFLLDRIQKQGRKWSYTIHGLKITCDFVMFHHTETAPLFRDNQYMKYHFWWNFFFFFSQFSLIQCHNKDQQNEKQPEVKINKYSHKTLNFTFMQLNNVCSFTITSTSLLTWFINAYHTSPLIHTLPIKLY